MCKNLIHVATNTNYSTLKRFTKWKVMIFPFSDMDARPWDFQAEECALRACVDRFNSRRYEQSSPGKDPELEAVDNNLQSVLGHCLELSEEFKRFYEVWLDREVFSTQIDWDLLLKDNIIV